jgi:acetyl esterase/lipase
MDFIATLDPELARALEAVPEASDSDWDDLPAIRASMEEMRVQMRATLPDLAGVIKEDRTAPAAEGAPDVPVRIYRPADAETPLPCLVWIHGGGMVVGSLEGDDLDMQTVVDAVGCATVSVEYRLAPENPYPAPIEDCYAALCWTWERAGEIGIDPGRIAIGGSSAGGGLAAGLALLARDRGEVPVAFQWLIYPMLDDRNVTPSSHAITDSRVWNRDSNLHGWRAYLGVEPGSEGVSFYASPARAGDLSGLPPAYIQVGSRDLFLDEDMIYAQRLLQAGVPVELHVYPGVFHGSEGGVPDAAVSVRMVAERQDALRRALFPAGARTSS